MGLLIQEDDRLVVSLPSRCLIGRGTSARLRLTERRVSSEHAVIYFDGDHWLLRDLCSRNGTLVNGVSVGTVRSHRLAQNDVLSFGGAARGQVWRLLSDLPPGPAARSKTGRIVEANAGALWLPSLDDAQVSITFDEGVWTMSGPLGASRVVDGSWVRVAGTSWRLYLPSLELHSTSTTGNDSSADGRLEFSVSLDQEHIQLVVAWGGAIAEVGSRSFNLALLTLARRRLDDEAADIVSTEAGWMYSDDLRDSVGLDRESLNLQLWRATQHLGKLGLSGQQLIERRLDTRQIRIGFHCLVRAIESATSR